MYIDILQLVARAYYWSIGVDSNMDTVTVIFMVIVLGVNGPYCVMNA